MGFPELPENFKVKQNMLEEFLLRVVASSYGKEAGMW